VGRPAHGRHSHALVIMQTVDEAGDAAVSHRSLQGIYGGFRPKKLPAVPGLEGAGAHGACSPWHCGAHEHSHLHCLGLCLGSSTAQRRLLQACLALERLRCVLSVPAPGMGVIEQIGEGVTDWCL